MSSLPKSMNIIKQVLTGRKNGKSIRELADMFSLSPTTVQRYCTMAKEDPLGVDVLLKLDDPELNHRFNGGNPAYCDARFEDFRSRLPHFEQQLRHKHMTVTLLWEEYRRDKPDGYSLTQFRYHLRQNIVAVKPSTVLKMMHQPGARLYIDFAGDKLSYVDMETGENVEVEMFAAVLPFSGYTFITGIPSQGIEHFLGAVSQALHFFGGVPRLLVPDNLKSAVTIPDKYAPTLTEGMNELATHYGCNVLPARVRKPKDKALVEDAVHKSYMRIYAPLRNREFHSIEELNAAIADKLAKYNAKRMQGCDYSRVERFMAAEKQELLPLPRDRYQMRRHAVCKVAPNSFIQLGRERHHYSVPCRYIGHQVEVTFTDTQVRIYHSGKCIATHIRSFRQGGHTYVKEHLPSQTQAYYEYSPQYFIDKGAGYGDATQHVLRQVFSDTTKPVEILYGAAQGILKLARDTEPEIFLLACQVSIKYDKCNYMFIRNLVKSKCRGYLALQSERNNPSDTAPATHENIRGKLYFK